jgi:hypothetical protein
MFKILNFDSASLPLSSSFLFFSSKTTSSFVFNCDQLDLWRISVLAHYDLLCCSTGYMDPEAFNNRLCARALYDYTARQVKVSHLGI